MQPTRQQFYKQILQIQIRIQPSTNVDKGEMSIITTKEEKYPSERNDKKEMRIRPGQHTDLRSTIEFFPITNLQFIVFIHDLLNDCQQLRRIERW
jgi:hypothetical protein